jgi:hypothetical protein
VVLPTLEGISLFWVPILFANSPIVQPGSSWKEVMRAAGSIEPVRGDDHILLA